MSEILRALRPSGARATYKGLSGWPGEAINCILGAASSAGVGWLAFTSCMGIDDQRCNVIRCAQDGYECVKSKRWR